MFKKGDIVVIEEVGEASCMCGDGLEGSIIQISNNEYTSEGTDLKQRHSGFMSASYTFLTNSLLFKKESYCCSLRVRKIDRPLKFRGGKVINVEEASTPF